MNNDFYNFKFIIVGDSYVGKTSILSRYKGDKFDVIYSVTPVIDYFKKEIKSSKCKPIHLSIYDTCGFEKYRSLIRTYYQGADAALIVYDISKMESFNSISNWLNELSLYSNSFHQISSILIGNKTDLEKERKVSFEEGFNFAKLFNMDFIETSARYNLNIEKAFQLMINKLVPTQSAEDFANELIYLKGNNLPPTNKNNNINNEDENENISENNSLLENKSTDLKNNDLSSSKIISNNLKIVFNKVPPRNESQVELTDFKSNNSTPFKLDKSYLLQPKSYQLFGTVKRFLYSINPC